MKKEVRIGLLFFAAMIVLLVGYKYLQGKELLDDSLHYKVRYDSVDKLEKSAKVYANGFQVGTVTDLYLDPDDPDYVIVELKVRPEITLPKDTRAVLVDEGVFGGKSLELRFEKICHENCLEEHSFIKSGKAGPLSAFLGAPEQIDPYMQKVSSGIDSLFQALSTQIDDPAHQDKVTETIRALHQTATTLAKITQDVQKMTDASSGNLNRMMSNLAAITAEIRRNNHHISGVLAHVDSISAQLADAGLKKTVENTSKAIVELRNGLIGFKQTLSGVDKAIGQANDLLSSVNDGKGTLGKLKKDQALYDELNATINNLNKLVEDMRLHPKRYIHFSVFD